MWETGVAVQAAGALLSGIEPLILTEGWSLLGTISANKKVFRSVGSSGTDNIIIIIDDNAATYTSLQACSAYNDQTKAVSEATTARYLMKTTAANNVWWLSATLDRLLISSKCLRGTSFNYDSVYCGLINRYRPVDSKCILITGNSVNNAALGLVNNNTFSGGVGKLLADNAGSLNRTVHAVSLNACFGSGQLPNPVDGKIIMSPIIIGQLSSDISGELIGVYSVTGAAVAQEERFIVADTEYMCMITGAYPIAIDTTL